MASAWITKRKTADGAIRHRVEWRAGGRESATKYGGSFKRKSDAVARRNWISGELAAERMPKLGQFAAEPARAPTIAEARAERWRASRVDVTEGTRRPAPRSRSPRVLPVLGAQRVDEITVRGRQPAS